MIENQQTALLRRMLGQQIDDVAQSPLTSSRAVRMALTKSANDTVGLAVTVNSVDETVQPLDEMLASLNSDLMLIDLRRNGVSVGLIALDVQMRAAILEMQTMGQVASQLVAERAATGTDKRMCDPWLTAFLLALPQAVIGTEFEGWFDAVMHHHMFADARAAGLILGDLEYRSLRLKVDLGVSEREGQVFLSLPLAAQDQPAVKDVPATVDWDTAFHGAVSDAAAVFDAILFRFSISLLQAENLQVGQVLPLLGCTVSSVRLVALDGHVVRQAKLGQVGGTRAVRIEKEPLLQMGELAGSVPVSRISAVIADNLGRVKSDVTAHAVVADKSALDTAALGDTT